MCSMPAHCADLFPMQRRAGPGVRGRSRAVTSRAVLVWAVTLWAVAGSAGALHQMALQFTWGTFSFAFDSEQQQQELSARADFAPQNATPFDVDVDPHTERVFLSFPAILPGSQVALATIKDKKKRDSPQLAPYPDWSWHAGQRGCDGLTSVFRIQIDKCRRLWVIDSGIVDAANTFQHKCPPQLLVFDLKTDKLIVRHRLPVEQNQTTMMLNVLVEQLDESCGDDAFAYVADARSFAIYVFRLRTGRSWKVESDTFLPDRNASHFEIEGSSFTVEEGVLGLAQDDENLYYHAYSSYQEGKVLKSVIREEALFADGTNRATEEFKFIGSRAKQSTGEAMSKHRVMFFGDQGSNAIFCWDASTAYTRENHQIVEHDDKLLHFVTGVKVICQDNSEEEVWAIDNNGQRLFAGEFQPNQPYTVNVVRGPVNSLLSKCKKSGWFSWFPNIAGIFGG